MPSHTLSTTGTLLRVDPAQWAEIVVAVGGEKQAEGALAAVQRLFAALFPTVSGPCDPTDFAAASAVGDKGADLYMYDDVPFGVDLAIGAFDQVADLADRATEVLDCDCPDDGGCFKCVQNQRQEEPASKRAAGVLLQHLRDELALPGTVAVAEEQPPPAATVRQCPDPKCQAIVSSPTARCCDQCGTRLGEAQ